MTLPNSAKEFLRIGNSLIGSNCRLVDLAKKTNLPVSQLLSKIHRFNLEPHSRIHVCIRVSISDLEVDHWVQHEEHKVKRSIYDEFLGKEAVLPHLQPFNGMLCLSDEDIYRLTKKRSIKLKKIWESETEYIEAKTPIAVELSDLLVDKTTITSWFKSGSLPSGLIVNEDISKYIKKHHPSEPAKLIEEIEKLRKDKSELEALITKLQTERSMGEPNNKHNLYGIIAGLTTLMSEGNISTYLTNSRKPNVKQIGTGITQLAARKGMPMSEADSIRNIISKALDQLESYQKD